MSFFLSRGSQCIAEQARAAARVCCDSAHRLPPDTPCRTVLCGALMSCLQVIRRVDPPSEGVEMSRTQSISLDVGGHDVVAHFGGVEEVRSAAMLSVTTKACAQPLQACHVMWVCVTNYKPALHRVVSYNMWVSLLLCLTCLSPCCRCCLPQPHADGVHHRLHTGQWAAGACAAGLRPTTDAPHAHAGGLLA